jgi:flagellar motor switch protein FliM
MQKSLYREQMEALLQAARKSAKKPNSAAKAAEVFRFQSNEGLNTEHDAALNEIRETLATGISESLGVYLRAELEAQAGAIKNVTFRECTESVSQRAYLLAFRFHDAPAAIQMDASLVFPLLDILLGGNGQSASPDRDFTEIEDNVILGVGKILGQTLATGWSTDLRHCELIGVQSPLEFQSLLPPNDKVLEFPFDIKLSAATGVMRVMIPGTTANALLRNLSSEIGRVKTDSHPNAERVGEKLLQCAFPATLAVKAILPLERILSLQAGQVCNLGVPLSQPALLRIADRDVFEAVPVRNGQKRAAHLGQQLPSIDNQRMNQ